MRRRTGPFVLLVLALGLILPTAHATTRPADPVREHLAQVADAEHLPGVAVAVVRRNGTARTWTLGEDGDGEAISRETPFLLGSVSKSFTATTVRDLVDRDVLSLDDRLGDLLPGHGIPDARADDITVDELLTHTSGLTRVDGLAHADRFDNAPGAVTRQATGLGDVELARAPGAGYEYSDLNYLLLGAVVEAASGEDFAQEVTRIAHTDGVNLVATPAASSALPPGHRQLLGRATTFDSRYDASGTPYGYLGSDLDGVAAWARAQLGGGSLDADDLEAMHTGRVDTGSGDRYGQGWRVGQLDGEPAVQHTGATPGYFAHVLLLPERDTAVVVLANSYSESRASSLYNIAGDVARIEDGRAPLGPADDPVLGAAPFVVLALAALGLGVVGGLLLRPGRRRRLLALVVALPLVGLGLLAPRLIGYSSEQLRLWAPDLGWGLWALSIVWSTVAVVAIVRRRPAQLVAAVVEPLPQADRRLTPG